MTSPTRTRQNAFTLVELLVVIFIIVVLIAILIPALSGARTAARKAGTQSLMTSVKTGIAQFRTENRRLPGYFSQEQMGRSTNIPTASRGGFTNMQNALIDLAGGLRTDISATSVGTPSGDTPPGRIAVGPFAQNADKVVIDRASMGAADSGSYIDLPPDAFTVAPDAGPAGDAANRWMPTIFDTFGQPIVMWVSNDAAGADSQFAAINAPNSPTAPSSQRARFYWASNAGIFQAQRIGLGRPQDQLRNSLLSTQRNPNERIASVLGIVGNPAFPQETGLTDLRDPLRLRPAAAKADVLLHSAGPDRVFLDKTLPSGYEARFFAYLPEGVAGIVNTAKTPEFEDDIIIDGG